MGVGIAGLKAVGRGKPEVEHWWPIWASTSTYCRRWCEKSSEARTEAGAIRQITPWFGLALVGRAGGGHESSDILLSEPGERSQRFED